jgi:uncharacterized protein YjbI with pentapeptide repeats
VLRRVVVLLLIIWAVAATALLVVGQLRTGSNHPVEGLTQDALEKEKLRQEILTLERDRSIVPVLGPWLAAAVAIVGVILTWRKQVEEAHQQRLENTRQQAADRLAQATAVKEEARLRELDRRQQEAVLAQRETDTERRFQEGFAAVALNLGSASPAVQASAAVSILSFLRPEQRAFHDQVFLLVLANLKIMHEREVNKLLVRVFERAMRVQLRDKTLDRALLLDLANAQLDTIDLSRTDLSDADIGFASLKYANLRDTNLRRARGYEVDLGKASLSGADTTLEEARLRKARCEGTQFHDVNLISVRLEEANLTQAEFQRARLQSAHLDETVLKETRFEGADLNDAFIRGLRAVDDITLRSIARGARNWRNAHFDAEIRQRLEDLSRS